MPRPMRLRDFWLCAGFSVVRLSFSAIFDLHEVPDLAKHACEDRAVVVLGGLADLAEAERSQRAAVLLGLANLATNLSYPYFRHSRHLVLRRWNLPVPPSPLPWSAVADRRLRRLVDNGMLVREHLRDRQAAHLRDLVGTPQVLQAVDRRLRHVDGVGRAEALREDVADAGQFEHGADAAAGDHARSFARGTQQHARGVGAPEDLVRDRRPVLRDCEEILLGVLDGLGDRERYLAGLAVADADTVDLVADHHERRE